MKIYTISTTFSDLNLAKETTKNIITNKLAACGQLQIIESIYEWKGEVLDELEYKVTFKTLKKQELVNFILENHPYEIPEIIIEEVETIEGYYKFVESNL